VLYREKEEEEEEEEVRRVPNSMKHAKSNQFN
jgi:hypothetical protein